MSLKKQDSCKNDIKESWIERLKKKTKYFHLVYYKKNLPFFVFILIYLILQAVLVFIQYELYRHSRWPIIIARLCGILLNFNSCFIILLVMRRLVTNIRNSIVGRLLSMDEFILFHKWIGIFILVLSILHTIAHGINLYCLNFTKCGFDPIELESDQDYETDLYENSTINVVYFNGKLYN